MPLDLAFWLLEATGLIAIGLFLLLLLGIRQLPTVLPQIMQRSVTKLIDTYVWQDSEEVVDGKKMVVRRPNPQIVAMMDAMAPIFIKHGLEWASKNIKLGAPGGPGSPGGLGGLLGQALPAKLRGFAPILEPFLAKFLGGLGGGAPAAGGKAAGHLPPNPFMGS